MLGGGFRPLLLELAHQRAHVARVGQLYAAQPQRPVKGPGVFVQDSRNAQVVRGLGVLLVVVHKNALVVRQVVLLHQQRIDLRVRLEHMYIAGGNAAVKQWEKVPLFEVVHRIGRNVGKIIQPVPGQLQLAHGVDGALLGVQETFPFVNDRLHLKRAAAGGGVFQHDAVGRAARNDAAVQVLPLLAAKGQRIDDLLRLAVHEAVHQEVFGRIVDNDAAKVEDDIFIGSHRTLLSVLPARRPGL